MASEKTEGSQATLDALDLMHDMDKPVDERFDVDFTDHDPAEGGSRQAGEASRGSGSSSGNR